MKKGQRRFCLAVGLNAAVVGKMKEAVGWFPLACEAMRSPFPLSVAGRIFIILTASTFS